MIKRIEKFGAEWCGPCKMLARTLKEFSVKHPEIEVIQYDVDEDIELAEKYGIRTVPVMFLYDEEDVLVQKIVGAINLETLENQL